MKSPEYEGERGHRSRGLPSRVFPLLLADGAPPSLWGAWRDRWRATDTKRGLKLRLAGAGWTFFVGETNDTRRPILRAEWDTDDSGTTGRPQPHWHVGGVVAEGVVQPGRLGEPLEEVTGDADRSPLVEMQASGRWACDLERLHLAMCVLTDRTAQASWTSAPADLAHLKRWSLAVLDLTLSELQAAGLC